LWPRALMHHRSRARDILYPNTQIIAEMLSSACLHACCCSITKRKSTNNCRKMANSALKKPSSPVKYLLLYFFLNFKDSVDLVTSNTGIKQPKP
ncbi:MAG: hypothetical protein AAGG02_20225, partial [Cyanobacteria bacterium P01_H01_bin.15]